jgi:hypothetical protein
MTDLTASSTSRSRFHVGITMVIRGCALRGDARDSSEGQRTMADGIDVLHVVGAYFPNSVGGTVRSMFRR